MGFQDVAFLLSRASFYNTCLNICGRGEGLRTTACLRTVVGGKQGHAPCEILSLQQFLFLVSVEFHVGHKTVRDLRSDLANLITADIATFKIVESG